MLKKLKTLLQHSRLLSNRQPFEKRMLVDALVVVALSVYLISPLPGIIIVRTSPVISVVLVGLLPICTIIYLYRRMKYYASMFSRKAKKTEESEVQVK